MRVLADALSAGLINDIRPFVSGRGRELEALAAVSGQLFRIVIELGPVLGRLARVEPGGEEVILPIVEAERYLEEGHRIHVPVVALDDLQNRGVSAIKDRR